ncbi:hypothetical protein [Kineococcus sp. SYSU DK004]|uniref:hypothetical protein n=1 Tax=Kineococcus sp. SYSU DK004 TaxID=3383125 RepID=UPI003D7C4769
MEPAGVEDEPRPPARLPVRAGVVVDRDRPGRALRVTAHPDDDRVVLSTWQDERCVTTVRLDRTDVVQLLAALGIALLPRPEEGGDRGEPTG